MIRKETLVGNVGECESIFSVHFSYWKNDEKKWEYIVEHGYIEIESVLLVQKHKMCHPERRVLSATIDFQSLDTDWKNAIYFKIEEFLNELV